MSQLLRILLLNIFCLIFFPETSHAEITSELKIVYLKEVPTHYQLLRTDGWYGKVTEFLAKEDDLCEDEEEFLNTVLMAFHLHNAQKVSAAIFEALNGTPGREKEFLSLQMKEESTLRFHGPALKIALLQTMLAKFRSYFFLNKNLDAVQLTKEESRIFSLLTEAAADVSEEEMDIALQSWRSNRLEMSHA